MLGAINFLEKLIEDCKKAKGCKKCQRAKDKTCPKQCSSPNEWTNETINRMVRG